MKIFRAISGFLFFGCIVVLTSCATHSKPANMDTGAGTDVPVQNLPAVVVSEALGKTIIDMPLDANTQVYADHDADKNIKVLFTPPVTDFELPLNVTELVSDIQKEMDGDKVTALNVFLKANSKFCLLYTSPSPRD